MEGHLKEGQGWRLGWNPDATDFKGLVGGDRWAVEMTAAEFADFCRLSLQLANTLQALSAELMDEERLVCEQETDRIWVEVEGYPHQYSLRFILLTGRNAEGGWPAAVTPELVKGISLHPI
ncbi:MAG: DUF1818 family protein [Leptolyngbya sp. SIO1E4]|nr:DUF1818 family protein [Leptolyngbya sp. SIO1E4]